MGKRVSWKREHVLFQRRFVFEDRFFRILSRCFQCRFSFFGHVDEIEITGNLFPSLLNLCLHETRIDHFSDSVVVMFTRVNVIAGVGDEIFVRGQQLRDDILIFFQPVLDEHAGVVDQHVRIPLGNFFGSLSIVVLKDGSGAMETEKLVEEPHDPSQVFPIPVARGELFIQHLPDQTSHIRLGRKPTFLQCLTNESVSVGCLIGQRESDRMSQL